MPTKGPVGLPLPSPRHPANVFTGRRTPASNGSFSTSRMSLSTCPGSPAMTYHRVFPHTWKWPVWQVDERERTRQLSQYLKARDGDEQNRWLAAPHWGSVECLLCRWEHCLIWKTALGSAVPVAASVSLDLLLEYSDVFFKEWII